MWSVSALVAAKVRQRSSEAGVSEHLHNAVLVLLVVVGLGTVAAHAQSTWLTNPGSSDWNTATNWVPATVPTNGTAIFDVSNTTTITFSALHSSVGTFQFNALAPTYSFILSNQTLAINGTGIFDQSSNSPSFSITNGTLAFSSPVASSAGDATIINNAGLTVFAQAGTAGTAVITNNGATTEFEGASTAASSTITTNSAGVTFFTETSTGGQARFITNSGGTFDISELSSAGMTAGSIEGAGTYRLGSKALTVGLNNLSTEVTGTITDGGLENGTGGALIKVGMGTLTLTGTNTYSGGTSFNGGIIAVRSDSNLGAGPLSFDNGTLEALVGGTGIISNKPITLSPLGGTIQADAGTTSTLSGAISGSGSLNSNSGTFRLSGVGTLILSGVNTYGGITVVQGGTLVAGSSTAFSPNAGMTVFSVLDLNGFNNTVAFLAGNGIVTNLGTSLADLTVGTDIVGAPSTTFDGTLEDGASALQLTVTTVQLNLTAANRYSGGTNIINGGSVVVQSDSNLGSGPLIFDNGTLILGAPFVTVTSNKAVTLNSGGGTLEVAFLSTAIFSEPIIGTGTLTDFGVGTLVLTGVNTYKGGTNIILGKVEVNSDSNLGTGPLSFDSGTLEALANGGGIVSSKAITLNSGGGTFLADAGTLSTLSGSIGGPGSLTKDGPGTLILSGADTYRGATSITRGTLQAGSSTALSANSGFTVTSVLDLNGFNNTIGSLAGTGMVTNHGGRSAILTVGADNTDTIFGGTLTDGRGTLQLTKMGTGTLILTGSNTYTGPTNVVLGTLAAGSSTAFGANSAFTVTSVLDLNGFHNTIGSLSGPGTITNNGTALANLSVGSNNTNTTFSGELTDNARPMELTKVGTGILTLTGLNNSSGGTNINGGILAVNSDRNLGIGGLRFNGGALEALGPGGGIASSKAITLNAGGGTLVGDAGTSSILNGPIDGVGSLTKEGPGTLFLTGPNTYSGGTALNGGILTVHGPHALGIGNFVVNGGILNADPQPINVRGNYTQNAGGTLELQVVGANAGQYDFLNVGGRTTLGGALRIISLGFKPVAGNALTLVTSRGMVSGQFARFIDPFTAGPEFSTVLLLYSAHNVILEFLKALVSPIVPIVPTVPTEPAAPGTVPSQVVPISISDTDPGPVTAVYTIGFADATLQLLDLEDILDGVRAGCTGFSSNMKINGDMSNLGGKGVLDGSSVLGSALEPLFQSGCNNRWGVWVTGFGDFVTVEGDANASGYHFTTGGVTLGLDYRLTDHFVIGVLGDYSHTWTALQPAGHLGADTGEGGFYTTWYDLGIYVNAGIFGGHNTYETSRANIGGLSTGNTEGGQWSTFIGAGYDWQAGPLTIGPVASLQYTSVNLDGLSEIGSLAPLDIHSSSAESLRSDAGLRVAYQWQIAKILLRPSAKAVWEHEYKYSAFPITAGFAGLPQTAQTFFGPKQGQDSAVVSAGLSAQWTTAISVYVHYDGQLGRSHYDSSAVTGGCSITF
jgi:autotransporter-associated beta strand protein